MRVDLLELLHPHTPVPDPEWPAPRQLAGVRSILRRLDDDARAVVLRVALCMAADELGGLPPCGTLPPGVRSPFDGHWFSPDELDEPEWFWFWWQALPAGDTYNPGPRESALAPYVLRGEVLDRHHHVAWLMALAVRECGVVLGCAPGEFYRQWWDRCRCVLAFADAPRAAFDADHRPTLERDAALRLLPPPQRSPTNGCQTERVDARAGAPA